VDHPVVSHCAALTAECARKSVELDNSFASLESDNIELLRTSRDAIARSRQLIRDISERNGK
jgi:peroxiredoxin